MTEVAQTRRRHPERGGRGTSFRDSAITAVVLIGVVAVLAVGGLILLDPRAQAFWGTKASDLGTLVRSAVDRLPPLPWSR